MVQADLWNNFYCTWTICPFYWQKWVFMQLFVGDTPKSQHSSIALKITYVWRNRYGPCRSLTGDVRRKLKGVRVCWKKYLRLICMPKCLDSQFLVAVTFSHMKDTCRDSLPVALLNFGRWFDCGRKFAVAYVLHDSLRITLNNFQADWSPT